MAGSFPLLTDDCVNGPVVAGLKQHGWDVVRVVDVFGQASVDETIMLYAVEQGRTMVSTDTDCLAIASRWLKEGRTFRLIYWHQGAYQRVPAGRFLAAFDALAAKENTFAACVEYLEMSHQA